MPDAALVILIPVFAGVAVWGLVFRRIADKRPVLQSTAGEPPRWNALVIAGLVFWVGWQLFTRILAEFQPARDGVDLSAVQATCAINAVVVVVFLFLTSNAGKERLRSFGVHADRASENLGIAVLAFLASFPAVLLVAVLTQGLRSEERMHPFLKLLAEDQSAGVVVWLALAVIVAAPVAEELVFRVILQGSLRSKLPAAAAIAVSSLLFAGVHGFPDSIALIPLAVILGYVFEKRRSFLAVVAIHALFNATNLAMMLLQGEAGGG